MKPDIFKKLDALQDALIAQHNVIEETLEMVEDYLKLTEKYLEEA